MYFAIDSKFFPNLFQLISLTQLFSKPFAGLLTKSQITVSQGKIADKKGRLSASFGVFYHPYEVQSRGGKEAVVLRCL